MSSSAKWDKEHTTTQTVKLPIETGRAFREQCQQRGITPNAALRQMIQDSMTGQQPTQSAGIPADLDQIITEHTASTGETAADFLARAIHDTIVRDNLLQKMKR